MVLAVAENLLGLGGVRVEVLVRGTEPCPMVAVDDGIIVGRWVIVSEADTTFIHSVDVPLLSVVLSHTFTGIVGCPSCHVVV